MSAHIDNEVVIDAPLEFVWEVTNDIASWPSLFTEYAKAEIIEQEAGSSYLFRLTMHPDEQGNEWSWVSRRTLFPDDRTAQAQRMEKGWFKYMNIFWEYLPEGEGTRMRWVQDFEMKAEAPFDDESMAARMNDNTRTQMDVIKERVQKMHAQDGGSSP